MARVFLFRIFFFFLLIPFQTRAKYLALLFDDLWDLITEFEEGGGVGVGVESDDGRRQSRRWLQDYDEDGVGGSGVGSGRERLYATSVKFLEIKKSKIISAVLKEMRSYLVNPELGRFFCHFSFSHSHVIFFLFTMSFFLRPC